MKVDIARIEWGCYRGKLVRQIYYYYYYCRCCLWKACWMVVNRYLYNGLNAMRFHWWVVPVGRENRMIVISTRMTGVEWLNGHNKSGWNIIQELFYNPILFWTFFLEKKNYIYNYNSTLYKPKYLFTFLLMLTLHYCLAN